MRAFSRQTRINLMNWLRRLLTKPAPTSAAPVITPPIKAHKPAKDVKRDAKHDVKHDVERDVEHLRRELLTTTEPAQRVLLVERLGRALAERAQVPRAEDAPEIWIAAVALLSDKSMALSWVAEIQNEQCLSELAMRARGGEIRYAAVQRIQTATTLEQVAQTARNKDKRVYQHCAEQLRQRRQAEASAQRATTIAEHLQQLIANPPLPNTQLLELKKEVDGLVDAGEPGARCQALMQQALEQLRAESEALRDLQAEYKVAHKVVDALKSHTRQPAWPWADLLTGWQNQFAGLQKTMANLPNWLLDHAAAQGLKQALAEMEIHLAQIEAEDARYQACDSFLAKLEHEAPATADALEHALEHVHEFWAALIQPESADARAALLSRWQALGLSPPPVKIVEPVVEAGSATTMTLPTPDSPPDSIPASAAAPTAAPTGAPSPAPRVQARLDPDAENAIRALLDQLEQTITEGHLVAADALAKKLKTDIGGHKLRGEIESRWHSVLAQLETLRGWARWGTQQAREKLTLAAQELTANEHDIEQLASAINALRDEWKRLNAHAAASKAEWESFDATLERAYQPVALYRAEQATRQAAARAAREALCATWEAELAGIDEAQIDFKALEAWRAEWITQWRAAPQTGFRDERTLRKRFDSLIGSIDQRLNSARAAEYERREQLISAAQALADQADLRQAMSAAKALQQRWSQQAGSVRLKRGDDQKQWTRFRAACNAVFERLDAQRAEHAAERQAQIQTRQTLLDTFAATLAEVNPNPNLNPNPNPNLNLNQIKSALAQFRSDWEAARPSGREATDSLENRARELQQQAQQCLDAARLDKHRASFDLIAHKAALAERVETAAQAAWPLEAVLAEVKQAWDALPQLPSKTESMLLKRLAAASQMTAETWLDGRATRAELLLDLEIALGLPSPESFAEDRRERQLGRLQSRFGAAPETVTEPEADLVRWYATAALPDAELDQRIAAVVSQWVQMVSST
jgi:DNA repair protein SbcC/Rad50